MAGQLKLLFRPLIVALLYATAAHAAPQQDTLKLSFGAFDVYGTYSKRSCAAQTFLRSVKGQRMGFSLYWVPGKSLYVGTKHPGFRGASGPQQVQFQFPDGQAMGFKMKRRGDRVQATIGFGGTARTLHKMISSNRSMRIVLGGIGDAVDVDLSRRRELESAMRHCRDWLRS